MPSNMKIASYGYRDLNFVELNTTGTDQDYNKIDPESRFFDSAVFNLFTSCFEKSNNLYEYYDATRYNARYIVPLRNQLLTHLTYLEQLNDLAGFQQFINEKVLGKDFLLNLVQCDKNWTSRWQTYKENLVRINKELLDLVDFCIDEDRNLYVIGY